MKSCLKSVLIASAIFFAVGTFPAEEASAQGPIIRRMRERLNGGKALLPFVGDIEEAAREADKRPSTGGKKLVPSSKTPTPARKTPTPAEKDPTPAAKSTPKERQKITLQSPDRIPAARKQAAGTRGFGMELREQGDSFYVGRVDSRGNAAEAGLRPGDLIEEIGGAPIKAIEEFDAIAKAMRGGDRVEFRISRRGSKAKKVDVQFGQPAPVEEGENEEERNRIQLVPADLSPSPATRRSLTDRYEPAVGSGLNSIYDGAEKPSSILEPTPAPSAPANRVESLGELDFPALELEGGK